MNRENDLTASLSGMASTPDHPAGRDFSSLLPTLSAGDLDPSNGENHEANPITPRETNGDFHSDQLFSENYAQNRASSNAANASSADDSQLRALFHHAISELRTGQILNPISEQTLPGFSDYALGMQAGASHMYQVLGSMNHRNRSRWMLSRGTGNLSQNDPDQPVPIQEERLQEEDIRMLGIERDSGVETDYEVPRNQLEMGITLQDPYRRETPGLIDRYVVTNGREGLGFRRAHDQNRANQQQLPSREELRSLIAEIEEMATLDETQVDGSRIPLPERVVSQARLGVMTIALFLRGLTSDNSPSEIAGP